MVTLAGTYKSAVIQIRGDLIIQSGNSGFLVINLIEINLGPELVAVIE